MAGKPSKKTTPKKSAAAKAGVSPKQPARRRKATAATSPAVKSKASKSKSVTPPKTRAKAASPPLQATPPNNTPAAGKLHYLSIGLALTTVVFIMLYLVLRGQTPPSPRIYTGSHPLPPRKSTVMYPYFFKQGQVQRDIPYCNDQAMDLYYPRTVKGASVPVVLYLHGGGWELNTKASEPDQLALIDNLRDHGIMVASIDYRLMPTYTFPSPVEDALCAVRFLRANHKTYAIDPGHIGLHGFSAGGYLAAMVGTLDANNPYNHGAFAEQSARIQAVSSLAAVLDLEHHVGVANTERNRRFLRGSNATQASPITHVSSDDPPFLLIHGAEDQFVQVAQDTSFAQQLHTKHVPYQTILVQHAEHGLNPTGGEPTPSRAEVSQRLVDFYVKQFGQP